MSEQKELVVDKSDWARGPWDSEPDKLNWVGRAGLDCMIVRAPLGHLCGYVAVLEGHRFFGIGYGSCAQRPPCGEDYCEHGADNAVRVHGGLTYADKCGGSICHVPEPGRSENVWWLGFDTAHSGDYSPGMSRHGEMFAAHPGETYKTVAFVRAEVERLAEQLARSPEQGAR